MSILVTKRHLLQLDRHLEANEKTLLFLRHKWMGQRMGVTFMLPQWPNYAQLRY